MKSDLSLSICVPVYKGSSTLFRALQSIFRQNFRGNCEIVILDDNLSDDFLEIIKTKQIIHSFKSSKITYFKNKTNLGSALTIQRLAKLAKGDILTFLCQDDVFAKDAICQIVEGFRNPEVGVLTRPFFWFEENLHKPIRAIYPYEKNKDSTIDLLNCNSRAITSIFGSVGQISGLAYRKKYLSRDFTEDVFPGHIYPFAEILKKRKCMFLKDYIVAVSLKTSQTRFNSKIYRNSPLEAWVTMFNTVYEPQKFKNVKRIAIQNIAVHYEGLVQIKNYGNMKALFCEIFLHIKFYPRSLIKLKFWLYVFLTVFTPRSLLRYFSDFYKRNLLSRRFNKINFNY